MCVVAIAVYTSFLISKMIIWVTVGGLLIKHHTNM